MLTDTKLKNWRLSATTVVTSNKYTRDKGTGERILTRKKGDVIPLRKLVDRDGLYAVMSETGAITFRFDYRFNGRRETLTIGRYGPDALTLAEARERLIEAKKKLHDGISPAREKSDGKREIKSTGTFKNFAEIWLRDSGLADSTAAMRKHILDRDVLPVLGNRYMEEITSSQVRALCDKIKARGAPAPAVHAREIVQQVYRYAISRGLKVENPAAGIKASAIATFKPRDRRLMPDEIGIFFRTLDTVGTLPTLKVALKFMLLTLCRKGELLQATWPEIDFEAATWIISAERMKARRPHVVYLSDQAMDLLVALKTLAGGSKYLLPGRYETDQPMSDATLNRVISAVVEKARAQGSEIIDFGPHDMRRTASTLLHEAGFLSDWIEKCLAHEQKGVRAVYNVAEYAGPRRKMLQTWADMIDSFITGTVTNSQWNSVAISLLQDGHAWADVLAAVGKGNVLPMRGKGAA